MKRQASRVRKRAKQEAETQAGRDVDVGGSRGVERADVGGAGERGQRREMV